MASSPGVETQRNDLLLELFQEHPERRHLALGKGLVLRDRREAGGQLLNQWHHLTGTQRLMAKATFKKISKQKENPTLWSQYNFDFCQGKTFCLYLFAGSFTTQIGGVKIKFLATRTKNPPNIQILKRGVLTQITSQIFNLISRICGRGGHSLCLGNLGLWTEVFILFPLYFLAVFFSFFFSPRSKFLKS